MKPAIWAAAAGAVLAVSCSKQVVTTSGRPVPVRGGIIETMDRQVANAVDAGEGDLETRRLRRQVSADPANLGARLRLAARYEATGHPEVAAEHYRLAAERFGGRAEPVVGLARVLRKLDLRAESAEALNKHLAAHPESGPEAYSWAGILRDELGDLGEGEKAHREAIARAAQPQSYLHNNLGQNLLLQGRGQEAAGEFRRALELDPGSTIARNNLGMALGRQPERALEAWKSGGDAVTAHNNVAAVLIEQGRYPEARRHLDQALGMKPDHAAALANLALLAELDGRPAEIHPPASQSFWRRVAGALEKVLLAPEEKRGTGEAVTTNGAAHGTAQN